jgi:uncharacterized repeat protein (TIGR03803 family)
MKNILKKHLLAAVMLLSVQILFSQSLQTTSNAVSDTQLLAMTFEGGAIGAGTIVKININGDSLEVLHHFTYSDGANPYGTMVQASDGFLYGMTSQGGTSSYPHGVLFKMRADGTEYVVLHQFANETGENPFGSLIQTSDGSLVGMTYAGGTYNLGTIFKINTDGSAYTVLHSFDLVHGGIPISCTLMQATDGTLFGMTTWGGFWQFGTIFKIQIDGTGFTMLYNLDGIPQGALVQGADNSLFGVTPEGGSNGVGTIFRISPAGTNYTELFHFNNINGRFPVGQLVIAGDGTMYGTTPGGGPYFENGAVQGGGTLYKINADGTGHSILHNFTDTTGIIPGGNVIIYQNKLFGYTRFGGQFNGGVFFRYDLATDVYTKLADLNESTGRYPQAGTVLLINPDTTTSETKPSLSNFYTVNPETDTDIAILNNGDVITFADANIRVQANALTSSVEFLLDGKRHSKDHIIPFALFAEVNGDYKKGNMKNGLHTLTAIPYSKKNGKGVQGDPLTIIFNVDRAHPHVSVNLFPNPVKDNATIEVSGTPNSKVSIQITNGMDKKMKTLYQGVLGKNGFFTFSFSSTNLKNGLYILSVRINDEVLQKRFVID